MCKERKFFISCWVATMAAVQPLKITAILLVQCENHFDTLHKYILQIFHWGLDPSGVGRAVAEVAASCCFWPFDLHTGNVVVRGGTVATGFRLALSPSITVGPAVLVVPVAEEAARCCFWPVVVRSGTVAIGFGLAWSLSITVGCAGSPSKSCCNGDSTCSYTISHTRRRLLCPQCPLSPTPPQF